MIPIMNKKNGNEKYTSVKDLTEESFKKVFDELMKIECENLDKKYLYVSNKELAHKLEKEGANVKRIEEFK